MWWRGDDGGGWGMSILSIPLGFMFWAVHLEYVEEFAGLFRGNFLLVSAGLAGSSRQARCSPSILRLTFCRSEFPVLRASARGLLASLDLEKEACL
jgi:hypothetical protein